MKKGEVAWLELALSHTFDMQLLVPHLNELRSSLTGSIADCCEGPRPRSSSC